MEHLNTLIAEVEHELGRLSVSQVWREQASLLIHQPGVGMIGAMTILSGIGDISRFPTAKQLVGYAGLGASIHASGQTYHLGKITKQGRRELRTALVECAWIAVQKSEYWRLQFANLVRRMDRKQAITVIARKLLVSIWYILSEHKAEKHTQPQVAARSLMLWVTHYRLATFLGMTRADFVRQQLAKLGLADQLEQFTYGAHTYPMRTSTPTAAYYLTG